LLPDCGEVVLDRLQVYGRDWLVMVVRPVAKGSCCPIVSADFAAHA